jgi:histone H3/H4
MEFSKAKMKEVIKEQTDKRVSEESALELGDILETYGGDIAEEAIAIAEEKGRKTVRAEDIRDALHS